MGWFKKEEKRTNVRKRRGSALQVTARANAKGRDRVHKVGAVLLILVALAGSVWAAVSGVARAGDHLFSQNARYIISRIDITSSGTLSPAHLREYAGVSEGQNLFAINIQQIIRNLERTPRVRSAEVIRKLPDTLIIRVTERSALARIAEGARGYPMTVDRDGYILGLSGGRGLPLISGVSDSGLAPGSVIREEKTLDALHALDICAETRLGEALQIQAINVKNPAFLDVTLASGARVEMGRDKLKWRLERLTELIYTQREMGQELEYVDLTVDRNFPVRTRVAATEARKR